ncbi:MAG TPA: tetratricopeptide repeat protein [Pirellulales bacterium]|nr:tetratricopeptide repeat protein [Pirellulales bacterium]
MRRPWKSYWSPTPSETRIQARILAGEALYRSGRFMEAGGVWTRVLADEPENIDALRWLGVAHYEVGALPHAENYLRKVALLDANDPRPLRVIGLLYRDVEEHGNAVEAYRESLRRDPEQPEIAAVRFEMADSLHQLHQDREALELLESCDASADVFTVRAACLMNLARTDEATRMLDEAILQDPHHAGALAMRGRIALEKGDAIAAERFLRRAKRISPQSIDVLHSLIATYLRLGEPAKAKAAQQELKNAETTWDEYHKLVNRAADDAADAHVRFELGLYASRLGLNDTAKWWLRAAVYLDPKSEEAAAALKKLNHPYEQAQSLE